MFFSYLSLSLFDEIKRVLSFSKFKKSKRHEKCELTQRTLDKPKKIGKKNNNIFLNVNIKSLMRLSSSVIIIIKSQKVMSGAKENPENSGEQLQTILVTLRGWQQTVKSALLTLKKVQFYYYCTIFPSFRAFYTEESSE